MAFSDDGTLKQYNSFFDLKINTATLSALRHSEEFATDESHWQHQHPSQYNLAVKFQLLPASRPTGIPSALAVSGWTAIKFFFGLIPTSLLISYFIFATLTTIVEEAPGSQNAAFASTQHVAKK